VCAPARDGGIVSEGRKDGDPADSGLHAGRDGYSAGRDMNIHFHTATGQEGDERAVRARTERAAAFTELWNIAQEAHIGIRNNFGKADELSAVHRRINVLLIEKGPALAETDADLARNFLDALGEFIQLLRPLPGKPADQLREEIAMTAWRPAMLTDFAVLEKSHRRMTRYNDLLSRRYRELVYGETT
jgi:hypothetical protein